MQRSWRHSPTTSLSVSTGRRSPRSVLFGNGLLTGPSAPRVLSPLLVVTYPTLPCLLPCSPLPGVPILSALYRKSSPGYVSLVYILAPISLVVLNPIGFALCEYGLALEQRQQDGPPHTGSLNGAPHPSATSTAGLPQPPPPPPRPPRRPRRTLIRVRGSQPLLISMKKRMRDRAEADSCFHPHLLRLSAMSRAGCRSLVGWAVWGHGGATGGRSRWWSCGRYDKPTHTYIGPLALLTEPTCPIV